MSSCRQPVLNAVHLVINRDQPAITVVRRRSSVTGPWSTLFIR